MTRVKRGVVTRKRHNRILKLSSGNWGQRKNVIRRAKETLFRAMAFAFSGRKMKKREMRGLFITRIGVAAEKHGMRYSTLIHGLKTAHVGLNRKMLSQIAIFDPAAFERVVALAKS